MRLALLAALVLVACAAPAEERSAASDLYVRPSVLWPRGARLTVCWKNPGRAISYPTALTADDDMARTTSEAEGWAREAITSSWQRALAIDFVGWGPCTGGEDIPIFIGDSSLRSHVDAFGSAIKDSQMELNLSTGDTWRYDAKKGGSMHFWFAESCAQFADDFTAAHASFANADTATWKAYWKNCLSANVVHEFGHALGFLHEQYRRDGSAADVAAETACFDEAKAKWGDTDADLASAHPPSDTPLGPFDPESIMSYCRKDWSTYQPSASDIRFAGSLYGLRN